MGNTDRLIRYIASCNHSGIPVLPPDINSSNVEFTPVDEGVRFGLVGVRGVGKNVAEEIIAEREANGPLDVYKRQVLRPHDSPPGCPATAELALWTPPSPSPFLVVKKRRRPMKRGSHA